MGTGELFTKLANGTRFKLSSTRGRAVQRSVPRLERVSGAFVLGGLSPIVRWLIHERYGDFSPITKRKLDLVLEAGENRHRMLSRLLSAILIWLAGLCAAVPSLSQTESHVGTVVPPQIQSTSPDLSDFEVKSSDTGFLVRRKGTSNWERSYTVSEPIAVGLLDGTQKVYISTKSVKSPQVLHTQEPEFPKRQLKSHVRVSLYVVVDDRGKVRFPTVDESPGADFSNTAIKAVEKWSFQPATLSGVPVPFLINVTSVFTRY